MSTERSDTSSDSTIDPSLPVKVKLFRAQGRPEAWYKSDRLPDKPDRLPDSIDASSKLLDTVDTSDKSPDTVDDALPDSTKGRVMGSPDTTPRSTVKS
jgi:hypothetical protein